VTVVEVRKAAVWLAILEQATDLREAFEESSETKDYPFLCFHEIWNVDRLEGWKNAGHGWEGEFIVPMPFGIDIFKWIEARARDELEKLGVKP